MQCALIAMMAAGYRPATNAPGHHQTMIQSLPLTLGVSNDTWIALDGLRKKRNQNDYTGAPVFEAEVNDAIAQASDLLGAVQSYLKSKRRRAARARARSTRLQTRHCGNHGLQTRANDAQ